MFQRLIRRPEIGPLILLVAEFVIFSAMSPAFLSLSNLSNIMAFTVELGLMALAMTLLMTAGEFDLSIGSVFGFSAVLMWTLFNSAGISLEAAFAITMAVSLFIGWANGYITTRLAIPSFLVTLGMLLVVRGTALYITDGFPQRTWSGGHNWLTDGLAGSFYIGGFRFYSSFALFAFVAVVSGYVLSWTAFGNWLQARGVNVARTKIALFMLSSALAALAGITSSIRTAASNPNSGTGYELEVIAMVVIGGTVLTGGRGTIVGTVIGVFLLRVMRNGIVFVGVPGLAYNIFIGAIILGMMILRALFARRNGGGA